MASEIETGELLERVQRLSAEVDDLADDRARALSHELVASVMAMYGDGLARIMEVIAGSREAGATITEQLCQDGAVSSLLLIHDLYPVTLHDRVIEALDTVRPYMESHGGNVELVSLQEGVAKLALQGSCNGCAASRATLELAIKQALDEHAPDLAGLEVTGVTAEPAPGGFELPMVHSESSPLPMAQDGASSRWLPLASEAAPGELVATEIEGSALLLANVDGSLLAYRNECASCGERLDTGELKAGILRCTRCGVEFDLPRAGRAAGGEPLQLHPVPLLETGGRRVAV